MSELQKDSESKVDQEPDQEPDQKPDQKPVKSKHKHKSKKLSSCKCSKCAKKHTYVCCKCATIGKSDNPTNDPDCIKVKRDPQNIFITFLS